MAAHAVVHTEAGLCVIDDDEKGSQDHSLSDKWLAATVAVDGTKLLSAAREERIYPPYASIAPAEKLSPGAHAHHTRPHSLSLTDIDGVRDIDSLHESSRDPRHRRCCTLTGTISL